MSLLLATALCIDLLVAAEQAPGPKSAQAQAARPAADFYGDPLPDGAVARMGTIRFRHESHGGLLTAFSPDGKWLATSGRGIKLWEAATGKLLWKHTAAHWGTWTASSWIAYSPDGKLLAATADDAILFLNPADGRIIRRLPQAKAGPLTFSPDSKLLLTDASDRPVLWETATGKRLRRLESQEKRWVGNTAFAPDGRTIITMEFIGASEHHICHWDVSTGTLRKSFMLPAVSRRTARLSLDGSLFAVTPYSREAVRLFSTATGKESVKLQGSVAHGRYGLAFSPDGAILATDWLEAGQDQGTVSLWGTRTGKLLRRFTLPITLMGGGMSFTPDGKALLTKGDNEQRLRSWDLTSSMELVKQAAHDADITGLVFTPDGKSLVSASDDGTIRVWDAITSQQRHVLATKPYHGSLQFLAVLPDGKTLLSSRGTSLYLEDLETGQERRRWKPRESAGQPYWIMSMTLANDGRRAAFWSESQSRKPLVMVWDLATGKTVVEREQGREAVAWRFSPSAKLALDFTVRYGPDHDDKGPVARADTNAVIHEVLTGKRLLTIPQPDNNSFMGTWSPYCRTIVTATHRKERTDYVLHLWELATGKERLAIPCVVNGKWGTLLSVVYSSDGRTLATQLGNTIQVWDMSTGAEILHFRDFDAPARHLAFSPDGRKLSSGHFDSTILVWDVTPAGKRKTASASRQQTLAWWTNLGDDDARQAHAAIWGLIDNPAEAVKLAQERLRPAATTPAAAVRQWIADLDSNQFQKRQEATSRLRKMGEEAEPHLQAALNGQITLEQRGRITALLARTRLVRDPEVLRQVRAIEILESIATAKARRVLESLAQGAAAARTTNEARDSLSRLKRLAPR
jgi:WD40 repeat protein